MFDGVTLPHLVTEELSTKLFSDKTVDLNYQEFIWWKKEFSNTYTQNHLE